MSRAQIILLVVSYVWAFFTGLIFSSTKEFDEAAGFLVLSLIILGVLIYGAFA